jgi:hypothetical protein
VLQSWQGDDRVQFVELRMLAAGQQSLSNGGGSRGAAELVFDDVTGSADARRVFTFTRDLPRGTADARVLVGTAALAAVAGVEPDFVLPPGSLSAGGGRVCYRVNPPQGSGQPSGVFDCVAWGTFAGDPGPFGPPTAVTPDNRSPQRVARTGATRDDWAGALSPTPENNAGLGVALPTLCGDGAVSQGEACDGTAFAGATCASLGFAAGTLACRQCHVDTAGCSFCGNDAVNGREECDGTDLRGRSCAALGFTGGTLLCTDRCRFSTRSCDPTFFVPGGGPAGPECFAAWRITNGARRPGADGRAPVRQRCQDGDGACDADAVPGACTFTVAVCLNRDDARLARHGRPCRRATIERVEVLRPSAGEEPTARLLAALATVGPSTVGVGAVDYGPPLEATTRCTDALAVTVPTRGARPGTLVLRTRTTAAGGRPRDVDTLKLVCVP